MRLTIKKILPFVTHAQVLVVFLAFTIMVFFSYQYMSDNERKHLIHAAENSLDSAQANIAADLLEPETMLVGLSQTIRHMILANYDAEMIHQYMIGTIDDIISDERRMSGYGGIYGFFDAFGGLYLDSMGRTLPQGYVAEDRPWYKAAVQAGGRITVTAPYIGYSTNEYVITYTRQILDNEGSQLGIICLDLEISGIIDYVISLRPSENGYGVLLDQNLVHIAHPNLPQKGMSIYEGNPSISSMAFELENKIEISGREVTGFTGQLSIVFYRSIENGWYLGVVIPKSQYYQSTRNLALFLIVFGAVLALALSAVLMRMISARNRVEERMQAMFEATPLSCIMFDKRYRILECNEETMKLFGLSTKQEVIDKINDLYPEYQQPEKLSKEWMGELIRKAFEGNSFRFEWLYQDINGALIPSEVTLVRVEYRQEYAVATYIRDLRESKAIEEERRKTLIAQESSKTKSDFLARVSHEVRTPLNAILGIAQIQLQNGALPDAAIDAFGRITNSGDLLLAIINDILDLSKIEAGKMELMQAKYEVASLIHDTAQLNLIRYESKPILFNLKVGENIPMVLVGDELHIKQILNNLLSNAFKYTDMGEITLSVSAEKVNEEESDMVTLIFRVTDTGQGMTADQISKLGNSYSRFNMEANRTTVGTGLGMAITKALVNLMDGELIIHSEVDKGSVFTVRLPQWTTGSSETINRKLAESLAKFQISSLSHMKKLEIKREFMPYGHVLIVDDVETNLYVARGLMAPYGLSIDSAISGFEAIDKIKNGSVYDIIFMDHMMPKMDGMEAAKIIRDMGYSQPIVALTANALVGQAEMFMRSGFDDFISKPIDVRDLNTTLNRLIRDKQPPEIIKQAHEQKERLSTAAEEANQPSLNTKLAAVFTNDARKSLLALEKAYSNGLTNPDDLLTYIINVHAMKSALANIKENELSQAALKLEHEGREKNTAYLLAETKDFLTRLRAVIERVTPKSNTDSAVDESSENIRELLREKLTVVKTAAAGLDKKSVKKALEELNQKTWSLPTRDFLDVLFEHLLHSDFEEIEKKAQEHLSGMSMK